MMKKSYVWGLCLLLLSCGKEKHSNLTISFAHFVDEAPLDVNALYENSVGNLYSVSELKYFISNVRLYTQQGEIIDIIQDEGIHYIDIDYPQTLRWEIKKIPVGKQYNGISFRFGLSARENVSNRFVNPPQSNMAWPQILGGGYHYMMLNGNFHQSETNILPLNVHLGRGQIYQTAVDGSDSIVGFVDNDFPVLVNKSFTVQARQTTTIKLKMNINKWFCGSFDVDFTQWDGHIMQNQSAMNVLKTNGKKVFE